MKVTIPKNSKVIGQFLITHDNKVIYEETVYSNETFRFLSYSFNNEAYCLKGGIYNDLYMRQEQFKSMFDFKERLEPYDTVIIHELLKTHISKIMNLPETDFNIIKIYSAINFNR